MLQCSYPRDHLNLVESHGFDIYSQTLKRDTVMFSESYVKALIQFVNIEQVSHPQ